MRGGRLEIGNVELVIPAGALLDERRFILRQDSGQTVGAEVVGNGRVEFQNNLSAQLNFDISSCDRREIESRGWWVWRRNPVEGHSQKLNTLINRNHAITAIDSTSWFIIAN